jgi:hypothetical protein
MPRTVARKRELRPLNCWEFKNCGRGPGSEQVCPAVSATRADRVNRGTNGGRVCWAVAGTLCGGRQQGKYAVKIETCLRCDFYQLVLREERSEPCDNLLKLNRRR